MFVIFTELMFTPSDFKHKLCHFYTFYDSLSLITHILVGGAVVVVIVWIVGFYNYMYLCNQYLSPLML